MDKKCWICGKRRSRWLDEFNPYIVMKDSDDRKEVIGKVHLRCWGRHLVLERDWKDVEALYEQDKGKGRELKEVVK